MADSVVISEVGMKKWLEIMLGKDLSEPLMLRLFTNNITPDADTVIGDFTEMGAVQGYTAKTLSAGSWPTPTISGVQATSSYAQQTWTFTAGGPTTVYGYYVHMATTTTGLLWSVKFSTSKSIAYTGETISVTPQVKFGQT